MTALAKAQLDSEKYSGIGIGVIESVVDGERNRVPDGVRLYKCETIKLPGTLSFLLQILNSRTIANWISQMAVTNETDTVIVHMHNAWLSGAFLPLHVRGLKVVPIATFHGFAGERALRQQPLRRCIHRWLAKRLLVNKVGLTSVDNENLDAVENILSIPTHLFHIVPNGLPLHRRYVPPRLTGSDWLTLAQIGTLNEGKGWHLSVEAVLKLSEQGVKIRLLIAGVGPDQPMVEEKSRAHPDQILYLGSVSNPIENLLSKVDILVLPTHTDGLPMVILEAMSCGIPVISTAVGGIPELIDHAVSGMLVERNATALEQQFSDLYIHPEKLDSMSRASHKKFGEQYGINNIVVAYNHVYEREH